MQLSLNIDPDLYKKIESSALMRGEPIEDFVLEHLQSIFDEEQQAIRDLLNYLEPDIIAAKKGIFSKKTFKEIVEGALEEKTVEAK